MLNPLCLPCREGPVLQDGLWETLRAGAELKASISFHCSALRPLTNTGRAQPLSPGSPGISSLSLLCPSRQREIGRSIGRSMGREPLGEALGQLLGEPLGERCWERSIGRDPLGDPWGEPSWEPLRQPLGEPLGDALGEGYWESHWERAKPGDLVPLGAPSPASPHPGWNTLPRTSTFNFLANECEEKTDTAWELCTARSGWLVTPCQRIPNQT